MYCWPKKLLVFLVLLGAMADFVQFDTLDPQAPENAAATTVLAQSNHPRLLHSSIRTAPDDDDGCLFCAPALLVNRPEFTRINAAALLVSPVAARKRSLAQEPPKRPPRSSSIA